MAVSAHGTGTQVAVIGTEQTLDDVAVPGSFTLHVDLNAMVVGDAVELRIYQMVLTGGTRRVVYKQLYTDAQPADGQIAVSVPISNELGDAGAVRFTLKQTSGGARSFPWKVLRYA